MLNGQHMQEIEVIQKIPERTQFSWMVVNEGELRGKKVEPTHGKLLMPFKGCGLHLIEMSPVSKDKSCLLCMATIREK